MALSRCVLCMNTTHGPTIKYCRDCRAKGLHRKRKPCKTCGKLFSGDRKKRYCSKECRPVAKLIATECEVCGKAIERVVRKQKTFVCSRECQNEWALNINRGKQGIDWNRRSSKAKERYYRRHSRSRFERWNKWKFRKRLASISYKRTKKNEAEQNPWIVPIETRLKLAKTRRLRKRSRNRQRIYCPLEQIKRKRKWFERCKWEKKINNKLSNLTKRRRRKRVQEESCQSGVRKAEVTRIQMRFEWSKADA